MNELSHRRRNMLTGEYVLCSPHRAKRPWLGKQEEVQQQVKQIEYDEKCYLWYLIPFKNLNLFMIFL